jgi:hypothetical protein
VFGKWFTRLSKDRVVDFLQAIAKSTWIHGNAYKYIFELGAKLDGAICGHG